MATRALAAAVAGRRASGLAVLSSSSSPCRGGGGAQMSFSQSTAERESQADVDADATAAQVEAALNCKNVDVVQGDTSSATLVAADVAEALGGVGDGDDVAGADDAWVPDQETGVFVPAEEASGDANGNGGHIFAVSASPSSSSVLDQAVFVREEDMEDVERPEIDTVDVDVADAGSGAK